MSQGPDDESTQLRLCSRTCESSPFLNEHDQLIKLLSIEYLCTCTWQILPILSIHRPSSDKILFIGEFYFSYLNDYKLMNLVNLLLCKTFRLMLGDGRLNYGRQQYGTWCSGSLPVLHNIRSGWMLELCMRWTYLRRIICSDGKHGMSDAPASRMWVLEKVEWKEIFEPCAEHERHSLFFIWQS